MSTEATNRMIGAYNQEAPPTLFLTGLFQSPAENFHTSEKVEIDVVRSEEDVSIVIQDLSVGSRMNSADVFTNKEFTPPIHKEAIPLNAFDLIKRSPGQNPFASPDFRANAITRILQGARKIEAKIRRSIELQASQVFQTGVVTLTDSAGVALYTLDYLPKSAHFFTAGTAWNASGDPIGDITTLADLIRANGLANADQLIMGSATFKAFQEDAAVIAILDNRRIEQALLRPETRGEGATFQGTIAIGDYNFDIWTYSGRFTHPQTGVSTKFVDDDSCIVRASSGRMDATFGAIPNLGAMFGASQLLPELPRRLRNIAGGMDLFTNAWMTPNGEQIFAEAGARPLLIPTAIDTYGTIKTGV